MKPSFKIKHPSVSLPLALAVAVSVATLLLVACSYGQPRTPSSDDPELRSPDINSSSQGHLSFNQHWIEGLQSDALDLEDVDAVFWRVFSGLPDEVTVYPSENYYYFILYTGGRQIWGNIRLAAGRRERGVLSFAYFEHRESPYVTKPRIEKSKFFLDAHGLTITELDPFSFRVRYNGLDKTFNLLRLPQDPPRLFELGQDETFVMRSQDESGYQFFLLFNERTSHLFWVLNEEAVVPDELQPIHQDAVVGRRSGFVFFIDKERQDRKILAAVRGANATVNNYYDGPFDQLADNYVDETNVSEYLEKASPSLQGRIDKYGYFTDREGSSRVAVSPYHVYFSDADLQNLLSRVRRSSEPTRTIALKGGDSQSGRGNFYPFPTSYPTPYPTPYPTRYPTPHPTN